MLFFITLLLISSISQASPDTPHARYTQHNTTAVGRARRDRFHGRGTWYIPGLGACGSHASRTDYIVAINHLQYHDKMCQKHVRIINSKNGKSVDAQIQDKCPSCSFGSLDMSPAVFTAIADSGLGEGELEVSWSFPGSYSQSQSHHTGSPPHHAYTPPHHPYHVHLPLHHPYHAHLSHHPHDSHHPRPHHCSHSYFHSHHRSHSHIHKHKFKHKHGHGPRVRYD